MLPAASAANSRRSARIADETERGLGLPAVRSDKLKTFSMQLVLAQHRPCHDCAAACQPANEDIARRPCACAQGRPPTLAQLHAALYSCPARSEHAPTRSSVPAPRDRADFARNSSIPRSRATISISARTRRADRRRKLAVHPDRTDRALQRGGHRIAADRKCHFPRFFGALRQQRAAHPLELLQRRALRPSEIPAPGFPSPRPSPPR